MSLCTLRDENIELKEKMKLLEESSGEEGKRISELEEKVEELEAEVEKLTMELK